LALQADQLSETTGKASLPVAFKGIASQYYFIFQGLKDVKKLNVFDATIYSHRANDLKISRMLSRLATTDETAQTLFGDMERRFI
jgi:hypothetical protein